MSLSRPGQSLLSPTLPPSPSLLCPQEMINAKWHRLDTERCVACRKQEGKANQGSNAGLFWDQAENWLSYGTCLGLVLALSPAIPVPPQGLLCLLVLVCLSGVCRSHSLTLLLPVTVFGFILTT